MRIIPITTQAGSREFKIEDNRYVKGTIKVSPVGAAGPYVTVNYAWNGRDIGYGLIAYNEFTMDGVAPLSRDAFLAWLDANIYPQEGGGGTSYPGITQDRKLQDTGSTNAVDWDARKLITAGRPGTVSVDWTARKLLRSDTSTGVDWSTSQLLDTAGIPSFNWQSRALIDGAGIEVLNMNQRQLKRFNGGRSIDWSSNRHQIVDANNYTSIIWGYNSGLDAKPGVYGNDRILIDGNTFSGRGAVAMDWKQRNFIDGNELVSGNWGARQLNNSTQVLTVDWNACILYDGYGLQTTNWNARQLISTSGLPALTWGGTDPDGAPVTHLYGSNYAFSLTGGYTQFQQLFPASQFDTNGYIAIALYDEDGTFLKNINLLTAEI